MPWVVASDLDLPVVEAVDLAALDVFRTGESFYSASCEETAIRGLPQARTNVARQRPVRKRPRVRRRAAEARRRPVIKIRAWASPAGW